MTLQKVRNFLGNLFPPALRDYIPGSKLVAGLIIAGLTSVGVGADQLVELPIVGAVPVAVLAGAIGLYLFPEKPLKTPKRKRTRKVGY